MSATTPRIVRRLATRVLAVTAPLAVVSFVAWLVVPDLLNPPGHDKAPDVLYVVYQFTMLTSLAAGIVGALAHGQAATARAFSAGYNAGLAVGEAAHDAGREPAKLRVVE